MTGSRGAASAIADAIIAERRTTLVVARQELDAIARAVRVLGRRAARAEAPGSRVGPLRGAPVDRVILSTPLDPFMSLRALATYSGLSVRTLRHFLELPPDEALPAYRLPGKVLVRRSEFDRWLQHYQSRGRPSLVRAMRELGLAKAE